jgi:predicted enzyme related to lactoylglutathione lyase
MMANPDGTPIWFELNTADTDKAQAFYAAVIGWSIAPFPEDAHGGYLIATAPDSAGVGGIASLPPGTPFLPDWSIYFGTADVDAAAREVKRLGGEIRVEPMDIPGIGRFAIAADPQGNGFALMKGASAEPSTAFIQGMHSGHGVWLELATPAPDAALTFYGALFGWEKLGAMPMGAMGEYVFIGSGDFRPGAIMSSDTTGASRGWSSYFYVPDIDAAIATALHLGGVLHQGPDQIPGGDYSANIADANGARIGVVGPRLGEAA